jgi:hypothetical protein
VPVGEWEEGDHVPAEEAPPSWLRLDWTRALLFGVFVVILIESIYPWVVRSWDL